MDRRRRGYKFSGAPAIESRLLMKIYIFFTFYLHEVIINIFQEKNITLTIKIPSKKREINFLIKHSFVEVRRQSWTNSNTQQRFGKKRLSSMQPFWELLFIQLTYYSVYDIKVVDAWNLVKKKLLWKKSIHE